MDQEIKKSTDEHSPTESEKPAMHDTDIDNSPSDHEAYVDQCLSMVLHHEEVQMISKVIRDVMRERSNQESID